MKKFFGEFKTFISRGNVLNMAVGIIIGGAFTAIITALVDNIISPLIGLLGGANFDQLVLEIGGVQLGYGAFITAVINFLLTALVLFIIVKAFNAAAEKAAKLNKKEEVEEAPKTKVCPFCKSEIDIEATRCPHCTSQLND